jgi:nucleoside-diphosphate-sugar epimerase
VKSVLVTGGLGMVGSFVVESLAAKGNKVTVIDNLRTGRRVNLTDTDSIKVVIDDISNENAMGALQSEDKFDVVVHCAASYADPKDWISDSTTNILGTIQVAKLAKAHSSRVVYFQTALCYGLAPSKNPVPVDYPRMPAPSSYAITKSAGEDFLNMSELDLVTFRLANIIGPRNLSGALPIFYKRLKAGEKCTVAKARRDFVDVRDVVSIVDKAVEGAGHGAYHLSSGKDVSIHELFLEVQSNFPEDHRIEPDVVPNSSNNAETILLDPARTVADFGPIAYRPLKDTVRDAIEFYEEFGVAEERTHFHFKSK